jgi:hypothetical protein
MQLRLKIHCEKPGKILIPTMDERLLIEATHSAIWDFIIGIAGN